MHSMMPLGSCTMKLNSATEMQAVTWPGFANLHPFAPVQQAAGYWEMFNEISSDLCDITGYAAISLQPNSGAQVASSTLSGNRDRNGDRKRREIMRQRVNSGAQVALHTHARATRRCRKRSGYQKQRRETLRLKSN